MKRGVRDYFAIEHLWNARHMAELSASAEAVLVAQKFRGVDRAVRSFALAAILEAVAFLEALVNGVFGRMLTSTIPTRPGKIGA